MAAQGPAAYFDGVNGAPQAVTLTLDDSAIAIASAQGAPLARWLYSAIEQLPSAADRLRLGLTEGGSTARLDVRDPAFASSIKEHLGIGTPQHADSERRRRRLVVAWSAAAVAAVLAIAVAGLPAIAALLAPLVPHTMEAKIGAGIHTAELARAKTKGPVECGDQGDKERAGKAAFLKLFSQLEKAAALPIPIRIHIIRTGVINAGAIPSGILHFNMGMILFSETPDELAGVMGHELGHIVHRHSLRGYLHEVGLAYLVAMVVGDVFAGGSVIIATYNALDRRHSRAQERQADEYGVQLMAKLGADSHAAANLWERVVARQLEYQKKKQVAADSLLTYTHPAPADRAAAIRATPKVANPRPLITAEEWQAIKAMCSGQ